MSPEPGGRPPLVYSCSGSSNVAQLANAVAVRLDRTGRAEMSCIAGVGGDVRPLVRKAQSGRVVIAIDGCPLRCCEASLRRQGVEPSRHVLLHERGLRKRQHVDFGPEERESVIAELLVELEDVLAPEPQPEPVLERRADRVGR